MFAQRGIAWQDYPDMAAFCASVGVSGLSRLNHLSEDENRERRDKRNGTEDLFGWFHGRASCREAARKNKEE